MKKDKQQDLVLNIVLIITAVIGIVIAVLYVDILAQRVSISLVLSAVLTFPIANIVHIVDTRPDTQDVQPYDPVHGTGTISRKTRSILAKQRLVLNN